MKSIGFIGVSTANSSIMRVFPRWGDALGLDAEIFGIDVPINPSQEQLRQALLTLRDKKDCQGALVTTHKLAVYHSGFDLFESFDDFASLCGEVSAVKVRNGRLFGSAKDPITAGLSLEEFLPANHFSSGAEVLCFGDGGAATAIGWYLASRKDQPSKMTFFGVNQAKLAHLNKVISDKYPTEKLNLSTYSLPEVVKAFNSLSPESLIINATGMGKDIPGTPVPAEVEFPPQSTIWELNYRGSLEFFHQATEQAESHKLQVFDGWRYFIHGWTQVISEVFDLTISPTQVEELAKIAEKYR